MYVYYSIYDNSLNIHQKSKTLVKLRNAPHSFRVLYFLRSIIGAAVEYRPTLLHI